MVPGHRGAHSSLCPFAVISLYVVSQRIKKGKKKKDEAAKAEEEKVMMS